MRVITGSAKGLHLKMPKGGKTRPAMDRVKCSLFSILQPRIEGCRFLDLFAGSGSLGIEALSRGAEYAAFVDSSSECCRTIQENLELARVQDRGEVFRQDCFGYLKRKTPVLDKGGESPDSHPSSSQGEDPFDLVCIDPPYLKGLLEPILEVIPDCPVFSGKTLFIIERQRKDDLRLENRPRLSLCDERVFGDTILTFFKRVS